MLKWLRNKTRKSRRQIQSCVLSSYYGFFRKKPIKEKSILFMSGQGKNLDSNLFSLLKEISGNYSDYTVYLVYQRKQKGYFEKILSRYNLNNIKLVQLNRPSYWYRLSTCKFLINDETFPPRFIKREGQIYLNTWHGTPLKYLGLHDKADSYNFGNAQKNFLCADYLVYPNSYMKDIMFRAYSLNNLYKNKIINCGYPRNSIFFDEDRRNAVRKMLSLEGKQVIAYMPTWRGSFKNGMKNNFSKKVNEHLKEIDERLNDNQVMFVKLHKVTAAPGKYGLGAKFKHIRIFPEGFDTYDVLNAVDCLVTDYSSVMFDFACSKRNIVLFTYDADEYLADRGLYIALDELPFYKAETIDTLIEAIKMKPTYTEDSFIKGIIRLENRDSAKTICDILFDGKKYDCIEEFENNKENVYMFIDNLMKNGITTAAFNLINGVDRTKRNYTFILRTAGIKNHEEKLSEIPEDMSVIGIDGFEKTVMESIAIRLYYKLNWNTKLTNRLLDRCYKRNFEKYFSNVKDGLYIHYTGYGRETLPLFKHANKKFVYVHNDMERELKTKHNQHRNQLNNIYNSYDKVICVTEDIVSAAKNISGRDDNIFVVNNFYDEKMVREKAEKAISFDKDTECRTHNPGGIEGVLNSKGKKFITIGRFSPEKGHERLIRAFDRFCQEYPDSQLIIIGGHGVLYNKTLRLANAAKYYQNITIIKSILNPMPILKRCDCFVLSSFYEGLGLVLLEADCLGIPTFSADIVGPRGFYQDHNGCLVANSEAGLVDGMRKFMNGELRTLDLDYADYHAKTLEKFESLFN